MEGNLASLVVAIFQPRVEAEICGVGRLELAGAEIGLSQRTGQRPAIGPDAPCDHGCVCSRDDQSSTGVAIFGGLVWIPKEAPRLGQCFGQSAMSLLCSKEVQ